jgi:hypothetical protein
MIKHSEEFKQEAVRIALTSRLPRASHLALSEAASSSEHLRPFFGCQLREFALDCLQQHFIPF